MYWWRDTLESAENGTVDGGSVDVDCEDGAFYTFHRYRKIKVKGGLVTTLPGLFPLSKDKCVKARFAWGLDTTLTKIQGGIASVAGGDGASDGGSVYGWLRGGYA